MKSAPGMNLDTDSHDSSKTAYTCLKSRVEYVFINPRMTADTWKVVYWSIRVQRISIMKSESGTDKARIHEQGRRNTAQKQNVRTNIDGCLVKRRRIGNRYV